MQFTSHHALSFSSAIFVVVWVCVLSVAVEVGRFLTGKTSNLKCVISSVLMTCNVSFQLRTETIILSALSHIHIKSVFFVLCWLGGEKGHSPFSWDPNLPRSPFCLLLLLYNLQFKTNNFIVVPLQTCWNVTSGFWYAWNMEWWARQILIWRFR